MGFDCQNAYNIAELRAAAKRFLPWGLYDFLARGTEDELSVRRNRAKFEEVAMRTRVLVDVSRRSQATEFFGKPSTMPIAVAPTGLAGLLRFDGELAVAKAAAKAGIPFTLSTASIVALERVADEAKGRLWYQVYMMPDKQASMQMIGRARAAGYEALLVTVDTPASPNREYLQHSGFVMPMRVTPSNAFDVALHPRWFLQVFARQLFVHGIPKLVNYPGQEHVRITQQPSASSRKGRPRNDTMTWADLRELRRAWDGPLMLKGVLHPDDAARAADCGVDGVIVSNHGGRNFDSSMAPVEALVAIVDRVAHRIDVMVDGGVERGSDICKALAIGAKGVLVGRAPLWGVSAGGEAGASRALELLHQEIDRTLAFTGSNSVKDLTRSILHFPPGYGAGPAPEAEETSPGPPARPPWAIRTAAAQPAASADAHL
jgi:isopentenyl diphosphate isomerase/L-lactate dehydrogenase-like FMN-dependent dehydrogenase